MPTPPRTGDTLWMVIPSGGSLNVNWVCSTIAPLGIENRTIAVPPARSFTGSSLAASTRYWPSGGRDRDQPLLDGDKLMVGESLDHVFRGDGKAADLSASDYARPCERQAETFSRAEPAARSA